MTGHSLRHAARAERRLFSLLILLAACIAAPVPAAAQANASTGNLPAGPAIVHIGTYVMDISGYDAERGSFEANFYVSLESDSPVNLSDFEMMNGHATAIGTLIDTPGKKYYRVFATLTADPDFHRYPFDRHTLSIITEPRTLDERGIVFVIDRNETGMDHDVRIPGWTLGESSAVVVNHSYENSPFPYSRAVFSYDLTRDSFSTFLKFFLPVMLIVLVSLSSLMMKVTSRLGLNASMFLAAVLIHWRIADAVPTVAYATFLDYFMILTYATLVMVLVSGILVIYFSETKDDIRVSQVNRWSIRIIPALSVSLYVLLFLTLIV